MEAEARFVYLRRRLGIEEFDRGRVCEEESKRVEKRKPSAVGGLHRFNSFNLEGFTGKYIRALVYNYIVYLHV